MKGKVTKEEIRRIGIFALITFAGISISKLLEQYFSLDPLFATIVSIGALIVVAYFGNLNKYL